ncbi:uncharacterized protein [Leptinotarsa decemlineata]|uniref:uncharacterized protein n=1 Tax=Leptinotarsa decemlineata TaxID=7539 RepID=UPI000C255189|nr:zinc finger protein 184-like [Leptinotarsa decemlineata]XP_023020948.1 zinc finger protein 184-like [Leptinotarsa decemlineata]
MEYDFQKICRICLNDGIMMSVFKVNISKKMMACASVQVWQNDGLPSQICNKCSAKLHISFQFKKLCEKSDAKLRQLLTSKSNKDQYDQTQEGTHQNDTPEELTQAISQNNCIFIECNPLIEPIPQNSNNFSSGPQNLPQPLNQINYNGDQGGVPLNGYNLTDVGQVQVYSTGTYPLSMQPSNPVLPDHLMQQIQLPPPAQVVNLVQQPTTGISEDNKEKNRDTNQTKNAKKEQKEQGKQCPTCKKIFETTTKLSRHVKTHSLDMPYKCKACSKSFAHSGNFKIHLRMHTGERPFRCTICDKGCRQAQDLEKHMRTHTGERPHKCVICPKAFSTRSNLIAHVRTHTGERPYVCCVCQKAFCQSNELTKHMRTHTGEKSHVCDICNRGFNGSSTLIVHRRSHTGERPYTCMVCNKGFSQSSCLAVHMKRHNNEENYQCDQCFTYFSTKSEFEVHLASHEKIEIIFEESGDISYKLNTKNDDT